MCPAFLPGESHGQRSLAGYSPWGRKESDTTEATEHTHVPDTALQIWDVLTHFILTMTSLYKDRSTEKLGSDSRNQVNHHPFNGLNGFAFRSTRSAYFFFSCTILIGSQVQLHPVVLWRSWRCPAHVHCPGCQHSRSSFHSHWILVLCWLRCLNIYVDKGVVLEAKADCLPRGCGGWGPRLRCLVGVSQWGSIPILLTWPQRGEMVPLHVMEGVRCGGRDEEGKKRNKCKEKRRLQRGRQGKSEIMGTSIRN